MGLFSKLKNECIDIIEWPDQSGDVLVHRFDRNGNEIKNGAKLIVREGQKAVFVNEGKIADSFIPGTYSLETKNMPILRTLMSWPYGFTSPFKAEVYFIKTTEQLDRKWGTQNPVMMRDPDFGTVRLRARGNYSYKIGATSEMISKFVGATPEFRCEDLEGQLRTKLVSSFSDCVAEFKIPALDLAANYNEIGQSMCSMMKGAFSSFGLDLLTFTIENITLPEEVEKAMDERASMGAVGNLTDYAKFQTAKAVREAASNESGNSSGIVGMMLGAKIGETTGQIFSAAASAAPPPLPRKQGTLFYVAINSQQAGPFSREEIKLKIGTGEITRETLFWSDGMSDWKKALEITEIAAMFSSLPPPIQPHS
ncbi:MAG: hypothetical protein A2020_14155 [Lentisphaerae bacterium GWF2_45_14]|nr:MAG: hypothetical protein A2020_14155 [Lentisphaerae bacterium GWF2_45_14]